MTRHRREHARIDIAGVRIDLTVTPHHTPPHPHPDLRVAYASGPTNVSGKDLAVNLHDDRTATLTVAEKDALGADIGSADEVPVTFTADDNGSVITLTDNGDNTAKVAVVGASSVGQTATVTASATLPDGSTAQGTVAIAVVTGAVKEISVDAVEDPASV